VSPAPDDGAERERLFAALAELVAARGYRRISVDHLVELAAVERAAFDSEFEGLEECFAAAWEAIDRELTRRMSMAYRRPEGWQEGLRAALRAGLGYLAGEDSRARLYVAEVVYVSDSMRDRQREALTRLSATIDLGREEAPATAPEEISDAIAGAIWHRVHQLVQSGRGADLPGEVPRFMYIAVLPYRGAEAAQEELARA
jgi:AcrR family transcriptional regulator